MGWVSPLHYRVWAASKSFLTSLMMFNIGVELGQLTVIITAIYYCKMVW
jgi:hypothetical protein